MTRQRIGPWTGIVLGAAVLVAAAGCTGRSAAAPGANRTGAAITSLPDGHSYVATSIPDHPLIPGTVLTIDFATTRVSAWTGCNYLGGDARLNSGRLVVDAFGSTQIGCPPAQLAQEDWVTAFLGHRPAVYLDGPTLTMSGEKATITLTEREAAPTDLSLAGSRWMVNSTADRAGVPKGVDPELYFGADGKFTGHTGCRDVTATWTTGLGTITFGSLTAGKRACSPETAGFDRTMLAVLSGTVTTSSLGGSLEIRAASGQALILHLK
jgi:heat shock protein HslJ